MTYEEFPRALREVVDRVARSGANARDVRIGDLLDGPETFYFLRWLT
jgi:hypothetical protein